MPSPNPQPSRGSCSSRPRTTAWPASGTPEGSSRHARRRERESRGLGPPASPGCPGPARARDLPAGPWSHPPYWPSMAKTTEAGEGSSLPAEMKDKGSHHDTSLRRTSQVWGQQRTQCRAQPRGQHGPCGDSSARAGPLLLSPAPASAPCSQQ